MSVSIRKATVEDAANIAHVHVIAWQESYRGIVPQPYLDSLNTDARTEIWKSQLGQADINVFVSILDGKVCGWVGGGLAREPVLDYDGEIYGIYLLDAAKRRGIGRRLMRSIAEALRAHGLNKAVLWVLADNPSRHFYEHLGAEEIARKNMVVGGADLLAIAYGWQDLRSF